MKFIKGPDFPTGGIVVNKDDLPAIYETGNREDQDPWKSRSGRMKGGKNSLSDYRDSLTR